MGQVVPFEKRPEQKSVAPDCYSDLAADKENLIGLGGQAGDPCTLEEPTGILGWSFEVITRAVSSR